MQDTNESTHSRKSEVVSNKSAVIRPATENDIPRILELYRQLVINISQVELSQNPSPDDYRRAFTQIRSMPGHELLVAEDQGVVTGTMVVLVVPNLSHNGLPWALVENLVIDEGYRRRGLGKLLMDYAMARAKEEGCYKLVLSTSKKRKEAHRFYRSLGLQALAYGFRLSF